MHAHTYAHTHTHNHPPTHACMHTHVHAHAHTHLCTHAHTLTHITTHTLSHTHTHTHQHTWSISTNLTRTVQNSSQVHRSVVLLSMQSSLASGQLAVTQGVTMQLRDPPCQEAEIRAVTERSHLAISRFSRGPVERINFMALQRTLKKL